MAGNQAPKEKRKAKWIDESPNKQIRERLQELGMTAVVASDIMQKNGIDVTPEAVRQWCSGYARPDISRMKDIAECLGCSCDYLLGKSTFPTNNMDDEKICQITGLSLHALALIKKAKGLEMINIINTLLGSTDDSLQFILLLKVFFDMNIKETELLFYNNVGELQIVHSDRENIPIPMGLNQLTVSALHKVYKDEIFEYLNDMRKNFLAMKDKERAERIALYERKTNAKHNKKNK